MLTSFGTSLSVGILHFISALLIPKGNVRWVKFQCDCAEAFSRAEESRELLHFSEDRMKTWLKGSAVMLLSDQHSHLGTPSILPQQGPCSLCRALVPLLSQICLHFAVFLCGSAVKQFVPLPFPVEQRQRCSLVAKGAGVYFPVMPTSSRCHGMQPCPKASFETAAELLLATCSGLEPCTTGPEAPEEKQSLCHSSRSSVIQQSPNLIFSSIKGSSGCSDP